MTLIYFSDPGHKRLIPDGCRESLYQPTRTVGWEYQALELNQIKDIKISWKNCLQFILLAIGAIILK